MGDQYMTEQEINLACAKLDGWKVVYSTYDTINWRSDLINPKQKAVDYCIDKSKKELWDFAGLPRYTNSYDAIIPLIRKTHTDIINFIENQFILNVLSCSPIDLAIALLKAANFYMVKEPPCNCTPLTERQFLIAHAEWCDVVKYRKGNKVL
jgi:hypothetical protein